MSGRKHRAILDGVGLFLLAALVLGGGTYPALLSDFILQILALPLIWRLVMDFPGRASWPVRVLLLLVLALYMFQLWPVMDDKGVRFPHTLDAGRTLGMFLLFLIPVAVFHAVLNMDASRQRRLAVWFLAAVALNFAYSFLQFASPVFANLLQPFSWSMKAGFFANENHLAALFAITVPMLIAVFRQTAWPMLALPVIMLIIFYEFVVGSRAGIIIIFMSAVYSYILVYFRSWTGFALAIAMTLAAGWYIYTHAPVDMWTKDFSLHAGHLTRGIFARNTLDAILDHWPWGSGMGSFTLVYPPYGARTGIFTNYVNHAHNDWLELILEGGAPMIGVLAAALILLGVAIFRPGTSDIQRAAFLVILFLMLHSLADYPLRPLALSSVFALCAAIILTRPQSGGKSRRNRIRSGR